MAEQRSRADRLTHLVDACRAAVDAAPAAASLSQAPDRLLGTLARSAGYQRVSSKFCEDLATQLQAAGISTVPDLRDPTNERRTRIYLFDAKHRPPGVQSSSGLFKTEAQLSDFLSKNLEALPAIKKLGLRLIDREITIAPRCRLDILAEDKKTKALVGIELKAGPPRRDLVSQTGSYMAALKKKSANEGLPTPRLIIVTGQPDQEFQSDVQTLSEKHGVPVQWLIYTVSLTLKKV